MLATKQFIALFILVVIAMIAVVVFTQIVIFEQSRTYDLTALYDAIFEFISTVEFKLVAEQDAAVEAWIAEATFEVQQAEAELIFWNTIF